ncbi:thioredoxin-like protein [Dipodascopsis uninucleata]
MDHATARVLDQYTDKVLSLSNRDTKIGGEDSTSDVDDDEFLDLLESDQDALDAFREKRMQELHAQMKSIKRQNESGFGRITELKDEKDLLEITTSTKFSVVHFFHPDFKRCQIMNDRLSAITAKHMNTRFLSICVDNAPFLVIRLGIKVLPCVIAYIDGKEVQRLVGFDKLGNTDDFTTDMLEFQLMKCGVIKNSLLKTRKGSSSILGFQNKKRDDSEDEDWD